MAQSMQDKIDLILLQVQKIDSVEKEIKSLNDKFDQLSTKVTTIEKTVNDHAAAISEIKKEMASSKAEMKTLKTSYNNREQRLRASTIRVLNFPCQPDDANDNYKALTARIYDRIVRPAIVAAKAAGDISSVPQQQNAIEACFRAFTPSGSLMGGSSGGATGGTPPQKPPPPPPVIVRLSSGAIKFAVSKHRKAVPLPGESERERFGIRRFIIVEDLTPDNLRLLKDLQRDDRTDKVWSVNGQIHFSEKGKPGFKKVRNVFDPLEVILGGL